MSQHTKEEILSVVEKVISQMNFEVFGWRIRSSSLTGDTSHSEGIRGSYGLYTNLLGASLTVLDACIVDKEQREAAKSLLRSKFKNSSNTTHKSIELLIEYLADPKSQIFGEGTDIAKTKKIIYT